MRANRKYILADKKAEIGIGTMIVFIASILVAAVAAAVLLDTSTKLQTKSKSAGDESTKQIASNLKVDRIVGYRSDTTAGIDFLMVYMSLAPGASNVDLKTLQIQWSSGIAGGVGGDDVFLDVPYDGSTAVGGAGDCAAGGYCYDEPTLAVNNPSAVRDLDGSMGAAGDLADPTKPSALSPGDMVVLDLALPTLGFPTNTDVTLAQRSHVTFKIIPEVGGQVIADFNVPETFGNNAFISIA